MKVRLVAETVTAGAVPVPVRETICGLPGASSVMVIAPVLVPRAVGAKVTLIVQLAPAATEPAQVFVWAKSPLLVIPVMLSRAAPVLVNVTVCTALVVPTS